ncbi:MAG: exo-alpha-sialidase [Alcanivoracaceae bacterium]|nr:exo-alpha-sialidase [Alcanivoracaceae bacterium]
MQRGRHLLVGALLILGYFASLPAHIWLPAPSFVPPAALSPAPTVGAEWYQGAASDGDTALVHAAAMAELDNGSFRAVWFAGSREGGKDVSINTAVFDPQAGTWSDERVAVTREQVMAGLGRYVRKLGNAVLSVEPDGRLRLFVVTVSFGGWGASRITVLESHDNGESWGDPQLLVTSPFINISNLVKGTPVRFSDGSIGLPIYHEFLGKFGELLRVSEDNRVLGKDRIGFGRGAIQPVVVVEDARNAVAFMRNTRSDRGDGVWRSDTVDAGAHWTPLVGTREYNPGSAVGAVAVGPGHWLLAGNCNEFKRDDLCLKETRDGGKTWQRTATIHDRIALRDVEKTLPLFRQEIREEMSQTQGIDDPGTILKRVEHNKCDRGKCRFQYDYPYMIRARNGDIHIVYTWNKSVIRHLWWRADAASHSASQGNTGDAQ